MKTKHSPLITLQNTRRALTAAEQSCAHWDYEGEGEHRHDCCYDLRDAEEAHRKALKAWRASEARTSV